MIIYQFFVSTHGSSLDLWDLSVKKVKYFLLITTLCDSLYNRSSRASTRRASSPAWSGPAFSSKNSGDVDFEQMKSDIRDLVGRISQAVKVGSLLGACYSSIYTLCLDRAKQETESKP